MEQKTVNTYGSTWIFRLIMIFVCIGLLKQTIEGSTFYDMTFLSKYFYLCMLSNYIEALDIVFLEGLKLFLTGSIICYVIAWILVAHDQKAGAYIDIIIDVAVLVGTVTAPLLTMYFYKAYTIFNSATIKLLLQIVVIVIILLIHIRVYKRNSDKFYNDGIIVRRVSMSAVVLFLVVCASFGVRAYLVYKQYRIIYGSYAEERHVPRTELEDKICNYGQGVADGNTLYYRTDDEIRMVDADGEIKVLLKLEDLTEQINSSGEKVPNGRMRTIDYYDGWIYFVWTGYEEEHLGRLNVDTGNFELLLSDESENSTIHACAVRDGFLYYMIRPSTYESDVLEGELVYRVPLGEFVDMEKAQLYLGNLGYIIDNESKRFYTQIIYDEYCYLAEHVSQEVSEFRCKKNGYAYTLSGEYIHTLVRFKESDHRKLLNERAENYSLMLRGPEEGIEVLTENVVTFSVYGNAIYYLTETGNTLQLYQAELDGTNAKLIAEYNNYDDEAEFGARLLVCDNKVLVQYGTRIDGDWKYTEEVVHVE